MEIVQKINPGQSPVPEWVHNGAVIGVQGGTDRMLTTLDELQAHGVKVAGMWIQDWSGKITTSFGKRVFWNWQWNETWYRDLDTVIRHLKDDRGVRVTAYITAHLNVEGNVYKDAKEEDFWLMDEDGNNYIQDYGQFDVATADIMEPDPDCNCLNPTRTFYKNLIKENLVGLGMSGWMADFGEYIPVNAKTNFPHGWWSDEDHGEVSSSHLVFIRRSPNETAISDSPSNIFTKLGKHQL